MGTLMEDLQDRIEDAVNSTGTFDESLQKLADLYGMPSGSNPARLIPVAAEFEPSITGAPAALNYLLNNPSKLPTLGLDFISNTRLDSRITFTRASTATYFNSAGTLTSAAINVARLDYNPTTLAARGLLIEEQRTNSIRNNTMQGAVAGTPGTAPNNWSMQTTFSGLTRTIVGTGTENGITYIDVKYAGTTTAAFSSAILANAEQTTQIAAANGQNWTGSWYLSLSSGSLAGLSLLNIQITERDAAGALLVSSTSNVLSTISSSNLATQRFVVSRTFNNALTAFVTCEVRFSVPISTAVDFTLRIGLPQLEQGALATSVIPTTTTALTRSQDRAVVSTLSPWFNATNGTIYAEFALTQPASGGNQFLARFSDNGYNNSIVDNVASGGGAQIATASGGVFDGVASPAGVIAANTIAKFAGAYATNDLAASRDGGTVATDTTATIPSGMTRFDLGSDHAGANNIKAGYLRRITYYPRRLSNAELQAITA